jgi:uncharacterized protein (TIGR03086 family)
MPIGSDIAFRNGLDVFGAVVGAVPTSTWDAPSPCAGWTARDVLGHLGSSVSFGVSILEGRTVEWPTVDRPADLVAGGPADYWTGIAASARTALVGADLGAVRDTPMGSRTVAQGLAFPAIDLYVHSWDIGRAAGIDVVIPEDVIGFAHAHLDPIPEDRMRGPDGSFGPAVDPPADATPTELFIAWTGRTPR